MLTVVENLLGFLPLLISPSFPLLFIRVLYIVLSLFKFFLFIVVVFCEKDGVGRAAAMYRVVSLTTDYECLLLLAGDTKQKY